MNEMSHNSHELRNKNKKARYITLVIVALLLVGGVFAASRNTKLADKLSLSNSSATKSSDWPRSTNTSPPITVAELIPALEKYAASKNESISDADLASLPQPTQVTDMTKYSILTTKIDKYRAKRFGVVVYVKVAGADLYSESNSNKAKAASFLESDELKQVVQNALTDDQTAIAKIKEYITTNAPSNGIDETTDPKVSNNIDLFLSLSSLGAFQIDDEISRFSQTQDMFASTPTPFSVDTMRMMWQTTATSSEGADFYTYKELYDKYK
jgi:hypothetical protein